MKTFNIHGYYCTSNWGGYVIEMSNDGSCCRVAMDHGDGIHHVGKWQEIKYTRSGDPYANYRGSRLHLDNFIRTSF